MNLFRFFMATGVLSSGLLVACSSPTARQTVNERANGSAAAITAPPAQPGTVAATTAVVITVASFTLADDCPSKPKKAGIEMSPEAKLAADRIDEAANRKSLAKQAVTACVQTAVQLDLRSSASTATTITLRKVELLDATGKVLGELTPRSPARWTDAATYVDWDQSLAAGATLKVSWALSSPTWAAYSTTKADAAAQAFQIRLTVAVNGADQIVEGQATVMSPPAIFEPPMKT